ncbi:hypothetical protein GTY64_26415 [Streptomyces sp. SID8376]|nr:hypothetical protein [Streptomyces sp. XHT-2]MYW54950.1 hypothetical protein [Streptomyces sp. SID8376]
MPSPARCRRGTRVDDARPGGARSRAGCQVPENWEFGVRPGALVQPYSIRDDAYLLFLGTEVYLLACPKRCDPAAVLPVNQN